MQQQAESFMLPRADIQAAILQKLSGDGGGTNGSRQDEGSQSQLDPVPELQQLAPIPPSSTADLCTQPTSHAMQTFTSDAQLLTASDRSSAHVPCSLVAENAARPADSGPSASRATNGPIPNGHARVSDAPEKPSPEQPALPSRSTRHFADGHMQHPPVQGGLPHEQNPFNGGTTGPDEDMGRHFEQGWQQRTSGDSASSSSSIPYPKAVRNGDRSTPGIDTACQLVRACVTELEEDRR